MSTLNKCPYFRDKLCTERCQAWNPAFGCQRLNNIDMEILSDNVSDLVDELRRFEVIDIVDDEPEPFERVRDIW